jgi:hypothetical protein
MKSLLVAVAAIVIGGPAFAAERDQQPAPQAKCEPIAKMEAETKAVKYTKLNPGQYILAKGIYLGSSITPEGLPPGNGALLAQLKTVALLFWTRDDKDACEVQLNLPGPAGQPPHPIYSPLVIPPSVVMVIKGIGKDEIAEPTDDSKDELHL